MKFLSNMITSISVAVNIITAIFLLVIHLMEEYILDWLNYTPTGALWETICEKIYQYAIIGVFGDVLIAILFFAVIAVAVLHLNLIPIIYNGINRFKEKIVLVSGSSIVLIVEIIILFKMVVDIFVSI